MRILYLDTIAGIAGDMTMAACVAAGVPLDELSDEIHKLDIGSFELIGKHVQRNAIDAVHLEVVIARQPRYHRHLKDILAIIDGSRLSDRVKRDASEIFRTIAAAEAKIHDSSIERIHFHEVGALDSIIDIVGTAVCFEKLGVERVYSSPVRVGSGGFVKTQHGTMPTPTPATLEILRGYPTVLTTIPHELTTPTGAAIVKALSSGILDMEVLKPEIVGYGAGTGEFQEIPNLLRVMVADIDTGKDRDELVSVETNIDDMNPQLYPYVIEKLLASGANDAYLIPVIMKKGRPGMLLCALVTRAKLDDIVNLLHLQTSTIGVRVHPVARQKLQRREVEVVTSFGPIVAKAVLRGGREVLVPEFEECRRIAEREQLPLLEVMRRIEEQLPSGPPAG